MEKGRGVHVVYPECMHSTVSHVDCHLSSFVETRCVCFRE